MFRGVAGLIVLHLLLVLPAYSDALSATAFLRLPIELPLLLLVLGAVPALARPWTRAAVALFLGLLIALKVANLAVFAVYARTFNAFLHLHLVPAGVHLLSAAVGPLLAAAAVVGAIALVAAAAVVLVRSLRALQATLDRRRPRNAIALVAILLIGYGLIEVANGGAPATDNSTHFLRDQVRWHWQTFDDVRGFQAALVSHEVPSETVLSGLGKRDVVLVFVESYGRSAIENPAYAAVTGPTLRRFDAELAAAGFEARSAWLASPTVGGQSWLAHSTLLSGLHIDRQARYDAFLFSRPPLLIHDFQRGGWSTVAVVPGITKAWPDAEAFGYERVYAAPDLGYAGRSFGWVSMPDQYALSAFDRLELDRADRSPIMATVILISSHAPWTPIPAVLPWQDIGDGAVFDLSKRSGDSPEAVWADPNRIRAQYVRSIDYVLQTLTTYVAKHRADDLMMIVVGDHPPVPFVAGGAGQPEVPIHIISRDRSVLAAIDGWGWTHGLKPAPEAPSWPMESLRGRLLTTFTPERTPDMATAAVSSEGERSP